MRYLLVAFFVPVFGYAQNPIIDSLKRQATHGRADSVRVNTLHELATNYWWNGYDSLARQTLRDAMRLAQAVKMPPGEIRARLALARIEADYLSDTKAAHANLDTAERMATAIRNESLLGQVYLRRAQLYENVMSELPQARRLLDQSLRALRRAGDRRWEAQALNELAIMKMGEGQYAEAINLWLGARRLQDAIQDLKGLRSTLPNLGAVYLKINQYDEAQKYLLEAEKVAKRLNDEMVLLFIVGRQAEVLEKQGNYADALRLYKQQVKAYKERKLPALARAYGAVGRMHIHLHQYDQALRYSTLSQQAYRQTVEKTQEAMEHNAQSNFGQIYLALGQYGRVLSYAGAGLAWTEGIKEMRPERTEYLRQLAEAYQHLNQPAKALTYFKRYKAEADTMLNEATIQKVTMAGMNYTFEKKQQATRLQQARQQARIQALENGRLSQSRNLLIVLLALFAGIIGFVFWNNRRLRARNEQLALHNAEIESALLRGQTIERKRVASELHDSVATKVSALKWRLEALDTSRLPERQQQEHGRLLEQMGEVYDDIRTISHNLMPEILEKHGLQAALLKLADTLNVQNRTRFRMDVAESGGAVRGRTAYELYAITLELINNILKHAQAREADIRLFRQNDRLLLRVEDDGVGLAAGQPEGGDGMGLNNLRTRLERLGGSYVLSSRAHGGLSVQVQIPVSAFA